MILPWLREGCLRMLLYTARRRRIASEQYAGYVWRKAAVFILWGKSFDTEKSGRRTGKLINGWGGIKCTSWQQKEYYLRTTEWIYTVAALTGAFIVIPEVNVIIWHTILKTSKLRKMYSFGNENREWQESPAFNIWVRVWVYSHYKISPYFTRFRLFAENKRKDVRKPVYSWESGQWPFDFRDMYERLFYH